jgi:hypothetical protein
MRRFSDTRAPIRNGRPFFRPVDVREIAVARNQNGVPQIIPPHDGDFRAVLVSKLKRPALVAV